MRDVSIAADAAARATSRVRVEADRFAGAAKQAGTAADAAGRAGSSSMHRAAASTSALASEVHGLIAAYAGIHTVAKIGHLADEYTAISNRIRSVTDDEDNLRGVLEATFKVAQDTRSEWEETAATYQKVAAATAHLGVSQQEVVDLTKQIAQGLVVSGSTAQEARMTMMELTHAFELGALTGREFRVVLKDATQLVGALADASGHTRAEFISMGKHGKLTADILIDAFRKAGPALEEKFNKMLPTTEQSLLRIKNAAAKFFGETGSGSGVLQGLARSLAYVADHFETFGRVIIGVGEVLLGLLVLEKIVWLVKALGAAVLAHPIIAFAVALATAVSLLRQFGDELNADAGSIVKVSDVLRELWSDIKDLGSAVLDFLGGAWARLTGAFSDGLDGTGIDFSLRTVLTGIAAFVDSAIGMFRFLGKSIIDVFIGIPKTVGAVLIEMARVLVGGIEMIVNGLIGAVNGVLAAVQLVTSKIDSAGIAAALKEGQAKGLTGDALMQFAKERAQSSGFQIPAVDLSFKNPLANAPRDLGRNLANNFDEWRNTSFARDYVDSIYERSATATRQRNALERDILGGLGGFGLGDTGAYVKSTGTGHAAPHVDEKALKKAQSEYDKLARQLEGIERASNPATEALTKYEKAVDIVTRATQAVNPKTGEFMLSLEDGQDIILETAARLADARFPLEAWIREVDKEVASLSLSSKEREKYNDLLEATADLRRKGVTITPEVQSDITSKLEARRYAEEAAKYRETGARATLNQGVDEAIKQLQFGVITAKQFEEEIRKIESAYEDATIAGRSMADGVKRAGKSIEEEITNIGALMERDLLSGYRMLEDSFLDITVAMSHGWDEFAKAGKESLRGFVDFVLRELTRLLLHQALTALFKRAGGGGPGVIGGLTAGLEALGIYGGAHASGGEYVVPGSGPPDSVPVTFLLSPREHVQFTPPGQAPASQASAPAPAPRVNVVIVDDATAAARRAMENDGETYYQVHRRRNDPSVRGRTTGR